MRDIDIPSKAPNDAIMAKQSEVQEVLAWAHETFMGRPLASNKRVPMTVRRQDFNTLHFGESCMETPIRIGSNGFKHGLGTHANSEIVVAVPAGAKAFRSSVGIDNNFDTQGIHGSVQFIVDLAGKEVAHTHTLKGGDEPLDVSVDLPSGTHELVLKVDATEDGPGFDQSDWADARFVMGDGSAMWLDAGRHGALFTSTEPPFSFVYGGRPSSEFIKGWTHTAESKTLGDRTEFLAKWADPPTGLVVTAEAKVWKDYPAVDWVLHFENAGKQDTPTIEDIRTIDLRLDTGYARQPVVLHQLHGDSCNETSFVPYDTSLEAGKSLTIAPSRGRPSQETAFPFWNLQYADKGIITAVGWSGQWSATYDRSAVGTTNFRMGMEKTHLLLHPGETIRTPRVLMMPWRGDRLAAHNRFRRLMLFGYAPKLDGKPLRLPVALQTFDRYNARPGWATEAGQLQAVETAHQLGCDTYWFDAGWFEGNFPNGAGNWYCKPVEFPNGLKPVGDLCRKHGMRFVVWFEPCRVAPGTQIAREHPQFVLGGEKGGLFNLGDPEGRRWLTDLISQRISEFGVNVYREDYNIDPLDFWRSNDAPDRQGMTEIRFVEGHYAFWDELRAKHPGLWIDNCASGGRRIDLETCMRSVPLWRSDTSCWAGHPEWNQMQSAAIGQYLPLHTACGWDPTFYTFRSSATGGALCQLAYLDKDFPMQKAKSILAEVKEDQKYWYGDFYPLTPVNALPDQFAAYQFHRADLNEGLILAFRRPECNYRGLILDPQAIDPRASYSLEFIDDAGRKTIATLTGKDLTASGLELRIPNKGASMVVRYKKVDAK